MKKIIEKVFNTPLEIVTTEKLIKDLRAEKVKLSNTDEKTLANKINTQDKDKTIKAIFLYSIWFNDEAIWQARKKGVFRYSQWGFDGNQVREIISCIKEFHIFFNYSCDSLSYLEKKDGLSWLYEYYKKTNIRLSLEINNFHKSRRKIKVNNVLIKEESLTKNLLVSVDSLFFNYTSNRYDCSYNLNQLENHSYESISEASCYLINLFTKKFPNNESISTVANKKTVDSKKFSDMILRACKLLQIQEWEFTFDLLDYNYEKDKNNFKLFSIDDTLEKSWRMANIKRVNIEQSVRYNCTQNIDHEIGSLDKLYTDYREYILKNSVKYIKEGCSPRFRLELNELLFKKAATRDYIFEEEIADASYLSEVLLVNNEPFVNKLIGHSVTCFDIILFQRLFYIISTFYRIVHDALNDDLVSFNSFIPTFQLDELKNLLCLVIHNPQVIDELIDLFSYKEGTKLDLQYTPLIRCGTSIAVPIFTLSKSNLLRNSILTSRIRNFNTTNEGVFEPLLKYCTDIFNECTVNYRILHNYKYTFNSRTGECDLVVIHEDDIILFECKDSINPTSIYETRTTIDYYRKGAAQLDLALETFESNDFIEDFYKKNNIKNKDRKIHTCILSSNGLFNYGTQGAQPIRHARELSNILLYGKMQIKNNVWQVWENGVYTHSELLNYLSFNSKIKCAHLNAMDSYEEFLYARNNKLSYVSYGLNLEKLEEEFDKNFKRLEYTTD